MLAHADQQSPERTLLYYVGELISASLQLRTAWYVPSMRKLVVNEVYFSVTRAMEDMRRKWG